MANYNVSQADDWTATEYTNGRKLVRKSNGDLWCAYYKAEATWTVYAAYSTDGGKTWTEEQVSDGNEDAYNPSIAVDSNDDIHVVWNQDNIGLTKLSGILYRKRNSSWDVLITNLSDGTGQYYGGADEYYIDYEPAIAIDDDNNVHVVFQGRYHDADGNLRSVVYRKKSSGVWDLGGEIVSTCPVAAKPQSEPSIAYDDVSDVVHVAWYGQGWGVNNTKNNIQYRQRGVIWAAQEAITDEATDQYSPCVDTDSTGKPHVVWQSAGINYSVRDGTWAAATALSSDSTDGAASVFLAPDDDIHTFWHRGIASILHRVNDGSWQAAETIVAASATYEYQQYASPVYISPSTYGVVYSNYDNDTSTGYVVYFTTVSGMPKGNIAVVETRLHYIGANNGEYHLMGELAGASTNPIGNIGVVETRLHYIGTDGNEYYLQGELNVASTNPIGNIAIVESRIHYVGTDSNEYHLQGEYV